MNGFDFDNTLYNGESPFDFFLFCLKKKKRLFKYLLLMLIRLMQYKVKKLSMDKLIENGEKVLKNAFKDKAEIESYVKQFWNENIHKLKPEILKMVKEEDIIITASPRFLITGIEEKLNTKNIICTEVNLDTWKIEFVCYQKNKVKRFKKLYPNKKIKSFYTDSLNDIEIMKFSEKAYLVKGDKIEEYSKKGL